MLKRLSEVEDPIAIKVFREEIANRLESDHFETIKFLEEEGYTEFLTREEFYACLLSSDIEIREILKIEKILHKNFQILSKFLEYPE